MSNRTSIKSMFCWPKQWNRSVVAFSFVFCIVDTALCNHLIRNRESSTHHFCNRALLNPTEDYTFMASVKIISWHVVQRLSLMEYYLFYWLFLLIQWFAQLPACSCTQCSSIHVCVCVCVCVCVLESDSKSRAFALNDPHATGNKPCWFAQLEGP